MRLGSERAQGKGAEGRKEKERRENFRPPDIEKRKKRKETRYTKADKARIEFSHFIRLDSTYIPGVRSGRLATEPNSFFGSNGSKNGVGNEGGGMYNTVSKLSETFVDPRRSFATSNSESLQMVPPQ